jgi:transposase-like protein
VRLAEVDAGKPAGLRSDEREELVRLRRENFELRRANSILKEAPLFSPGARPTPAEVSRFIDMFRALFGVEPICRTLGVSASAYWRRATSERSARRLEEERLTARIAELQEANYGAYGYRRMWRALTLSGEDPGRDQVARLMRAGRGLRAPSARESVADYETRSCGAPAA